MSQTTLLTNQTTDGNGSAITWPGGRGTLIITGTFDGATLSIQARAQDGSDSDFATIKDGSFTAAEPVNVDLGEGTKIRANVSSAGGSTNLTAYLMR